MKILITGSSGHLGEALVRHFRKKGDEVVSIDLLPSPYTNVVDSILNRERIDHIMQGVDAVLHTATLHKPHVATHDLHKFIDANIHGTQTLLTSAVNHKVKAFIFTSTTSTFGHAMSNDPRKATWVTEDLRPIPKNIYGVTKVAAEDLCQLTYQDHGLPCLVLKTSRFFPEDDDMKHTLSEYGQDNIKILEFLYRRVDIEDVVAAHELAISRAPDLGFEKFIISATTSFQPSDCEALMRDASSVIQSYHPTFTSTFEALGWKPFPKISRVYSNEKARTLLGWKPRHLFADVLQRVGSGGRVLSDLAYEIGAKGYHR